MVFSDFCMFGLDGFSLFEEIMGIRKDILVILMIVYGIIVDVVFVM